MIITKYDDFLLESLLLESKVELSDKLINILKRMKSKIAMDLLAINSNGHDLNIIQNFIDATNKNDEVTFTPDKKAQSLLGDGGRKYKVANPNRYLGHNLSNRAVFNILGYTIPTDTKAYKPEVGEICTVKKTYTSISTGKTYAYVDYASGNTGVINMDGLVDDESYSNVWKTSRNAMRVGRLVGTILRSANIPFTDAEMEKFANEYKSTFDLVNNALDRFELVSGEAIPYWYDAENYFNALSTLGGSCMADAPSYYFDLYEINPNQISLLILHPEETKEKISGRALVWKTDEGDIFMDRIYTNFDSDIELFKTYAQSKGWWYKTIQDSKAGYVVTNGTQKKDPIYIVTLDSIEVESFPFVDSLPYLNIDERKLSNDELVIMADTKLQQTDGSSTPTHNE